MSPFYFEIDSGRRSNLYAEHRKTATTAQQLSHVIVAMPHCSGGEAPDVILGIFHQEDNARAEQAAHWTYAPLICGRLDRT